MSEILQTAAERLADAAIRHTLTRIRDDARIRYVMGDGSQTFDLLTAALSGLGGRAVEQIREAYSGGPVRCFGLYLVERMSVADVPPPVDETVLIWQDGTDGDDSPWLGHLDAQGTWWSADSGIARNVTHWARRPGRAV